MIAYPLQSIAIPDLAVTSCTYVQWTLVTSNNTALGEVVEYIHNLQGLRSQSGYLAASDVRPVTCQYRYFITLSILRNFYVAPAEYAETLPGS